MSGTRSRDSQVSARKKSGTLSARARALAVLRVRGRALAVALLPAAFAVVLLAGGLTGHLVGAGWDLARWILTPFAAVVLIAAVVFGLMVVHTRPAVSPTVPIPETGAPELYQLVRDLADRLDVPVPSAIALTPDCDSWLEDRTHPASEPARPGEDRRSALGRRRIPAAPVLVIGSPFLWWMRVGELRAVLAPVVAGTGPSAHPDIAAARRFLRGLDGMAAPLEPARGPLHRAAHFCTARLARLLLRACQVHAAEMESGVAAAAADRAQNLDYGLRIIAQEQIGLAYAGWDRLLTRVALPAWRMGRWPSRLDVGVVAALTELSRRDRLADGFTTRLGERPACDLLEEPGVIDEAVSLLAARLFHGGPAGQGPDWSPVDWQAYPEEVVDRKWRTEAARLHRVLDRLGVRRVPGADGTGSTGGAEGPTLARVMEHLTDRGGCGADGDPGATAPASGRDTPPERTAGDALAAGITAEVAREEAAAPRNAAAHQPGSDLGPGSDPGPLWDHEPLPLFPLQPPRTGRELLADHVTAMVCCAAMDTAGAAPGLDWLDGPSLLVGGERRSDLGSPVLSLVEEGDPEPLRDWLSELGVRAEKPVRLV